jgi:peptidoglycan/xylan/chitin deacetylase (PgdA/CDA1 family)
MNSHFNVPVLMYHTVGKVIEGWHWSYLTLPFRTFEDQLFWLVKKGFQTVSLDQLHDHVNGHVILPKRSVVLTFDDGYLDNWTYVAPLLQKYGFIATVFVNPEFVDPRDIVRPTLEDVWRGETLESELEVRGFMSWPELREIQRRGTFSVQSHGMSHTWYPSGPKIVDFYKQKSDFYWLEWNKNPHLKPFYLQNFKSSAALCGFPVYEHKKSLECNRYFPPQKELDFILETIRDHGGDDFLNDEGWESILFDSLEEFRKRQNLSLDFEAPEDRRGRYSFELIESRRIIEKELGTTVEYFCWPGGGYNEESMSMSLQVYKGVTLSSRDPSNVWNGFGEGSPKIRRQGVPSFGENDKIIYPGGRYLTNFLDEYLGLKFARRKRQAHKILYLLGFRF